MAEHTHDFSHWPFADPVNTTTFCTKLVARRDFPVLLVSHDWDGDWQFLDATSDDPGEPVILCLGCVFENDQTLAEIADLPVGWSAWRDYVGGPWEREENPPADEDES